MSFTFLNIYYIFFLSPPTNYIILLFKFPLNNIALGIHFNLKYFDI
jgi:hypothetical protein